MSHPIKSDDNRKLKDGLIHFMALGIDQVSEQGQHLGYFHYDYFALEGPSGFWGIKRETHDDGRYTMFSESFDGPTLIVREPDRMVDRIQLPGYRWPRNTFQGGATKLSEYVFTRKDLLRDAEFLRNWKARPEDYPPGFTDENAASMLKGIRLSMARLRRDFNKRRLWEQLYPESWFKKPDTPENYEMLLRIVGVRDPESLKASVEEYRADYPRRVATYERVQRQEAAKREKLQRNP